MLNPYASTRTTIGESDYLSRGYFFCQIWSFFLSIPFAFTSSLPNSPNCDGTVYDLKGRIDANSPWVDIGSGDLPWKDTAYGRNGWPITINSSYESGDTNLNYAEMFFPTNGDQFLEYRLVFTATRNPDSYLQLGEAELVGMLY